STTRSRPAVTPRWARSSRSTGTVSPRPRPVITSISKPWDYKRPWTLARIDAPDSNGCARHYANRTHTHEEESRPRPEGRCRPTTGGPVGPAEIEEGITR